MSATKKRPAACYCNDNCRTGFVTDRRYGAFYPAVWDAPPSKGGNAWSHETWSDHEGLCRYCGADVREAVEMPPPTWRSATTKVSSD